MTMKCLHRGFNVLLSRVRFVLRRYKKSEAEMNIAIGGLAVAVGLIGLLFLLVKVA